MRLNRDSKGRFCKVNTFEQLPATENAPKRINPFLLGCDPEFVLLGPDNIARPVQGLFNISAHPEIGQDCRVLVELRPKPAKTAYELTARIRSLLLSPVLIESKAATYKWRSGAFSKYRTSCLSGEQCQCHSDTLYNISMGGHVHFETKYWRVEQQLNHDPLGRPYHTGHQTFPQAKPLDRLTALLEHLDLLPAKECEQRTVLGYGTASNAVRVSAQSYEYRKMCSWLFHPRIAFIVLTLSKLCVADHENMARALYYKSSFEALVESIRPYAAYDDDAARLINVLFPRGLEAMKADHTVDFREAWKRWQPELGSNPT
jgi:hypothetical protein